MTFFPMEKCLGRKGRDEEKNFFSQPRLGLQGENSQTLPLEFLPL